MVVFFLRVQWSPTLRSPRYYKHLFLCPERIESPVISLVLQPRYSNHPVNTTTFPGPEGGRITGVPLYFDQDKLSFSLKEIGPNNCDFWDHIKSTLRIPEITLY